ncbi:hypothetical protein HDE_13074 [Halotydeus destructor]|nr:hypothetical protein HDE_13074 [Halotydeus destructor]
MATRFAENMFFVYHTGRNFESAIQDPMVLYLTQKDVNHFRLSYDITMVTLKADHRKSTCVDYLKLTSNTRMENIRDCAIAKYGRRYSGLFPVNRHASGDKTSINAKFGLHTDERMIQRCSQVYKKPDCVNIYYGAKLQKNYFKSSHVNKTKLELNLPYGAAIHFDQEINIQLIELLSYLGSLVGFYLGLSVYAILYSPTSVSGEHLYHFTHFLANYLQNIDFHHNNN